MRDRGVETATRVWRVVLAAALTAVASLAFGAADIRVFVNGHPVKSDVPPLLEKGVTYLPLRATAEAVGAKLEWDARTKTAVLCGQGTCYPIRTTDPASGAKVVQGRVLLPLRKAAEALGASVTWNAHTRRVEVATR